MKNKYVGIAAVIALAVGVIGFFGGVKYGKAKVASGRQQLAAQFRGTGMFGGMGRRGGVAGAGFTAGQILSKDDKSITVKDQSGGSKIIFVSDSTKVGKSVAGAVSELVAGQQVTVMGTPNSDGSITATTVDIRPAPATTPAK
jgi:hypothetical protein